MGEVVETLEGHRRSVAAPLVFIVVVVLQFVSRGLQQLKKRGVKTATANRLRGEIKDLLKEASSLSQPSTFAQAAKLRRMAAVKEKELANFLFISKVLTYLVLIWWFWRVPIASISQELVQPFGKVLSWRAGGILNENVMWKGLFGRLDWEGNFPTSITDPQPMGKVGMCFHPDQDRILTVRECARSQGFADSYQFSGTVLHKHRQIGNAVPPTLAYALGTKLKEAIDSKRLSSQQ
ncbi:hypothetical protein L3X38_039580 [Prunus dulcis]|uniref:DNA (cytosine-5-)-methyltransferase n=1 Tax=Prunus dulcis TaxID=3755 RepID=A0AAD4V8X0_PRUDU|nr:hypothetical protein L3X38_039580 [Prunus dulcis]